ncbi:MAG: sugar ABC transporter permease, partial [Anaerolineae bacterium]|nr:sugar ABC transporter permease [Anaerolineae bacterium]
SNGGFVNVALQGLSQRFFLFDWLHRGFIYGVETFNGFFAALSQGDPIGPLKYVFPAALAVLALLGLLGDWSNGKRTRAERAAELLILVVIGAAGGRGLVEEPINPNWTLILGIAFTLGVWINRRAGKKALARVWQAAGLILLGAGLVLSLISAGPDSAATLGYAAACALAAAPLVISLFGAWDARKARLVLALAVALGVILFVRFIPGQLDGGRAGLVPRYLTLQTALDDPTSQDYLKATYPEETMSSLWVYGGAAAVLIAIVALAGRAPRAQRWLVVAALAVFGLFGLGALFDTVRYFQAFQAIAAQTGGPVYHFTQFRNSLGNFPDSSRVALWMTSELWAKPSLILISVWSSGAGMLIFLAALQGVPRVLYESAEVDGANRLQRFWKITFPLITPALFYNVVIGVIAALQTFESIYILQTPQNQDTLMSAAYFLFVRTFRQLEIGQGAAASWILVILIVILTTLQFRYSNWVNYEVQQ